LRTPILIPEQQSYSGGAQCVLEVILDALREDFHPLVAFPEDGPFVNTLQDRNIETLLYPLGGYRRGCKSLVDMANFGAQSLYCGSRRLFSSVAPSLSTSTVPGASRQGPCPPS
jgi:hypothetical protein